MQFRLKHLRSRADHMASNVDRAWWSAFDLISNEIFHWVLFAVPLTQIRIISDVSLLISFAFHSIWLCEM